MAPDAVELDQRRIVTDCSQAFGEVALLLYGKENIRLNAYDERTLQIQVLKS